MINFVRTDPSGRDAAPRLAACGSIRKPKESDAPIGIHTKRPSDRVTATNAALSDRVYTMRARRYAHERLESRLSGSTAPCEWLSATFYKSGVFSIAPRSIAWCSARRTPRAKLDFESAVRFRVAISRRPFAWMAKRLAASSYFVIKSLNDIGRNNYFVIRNKYKFKQYYNNIDNDNSIKH